MPVAKGKGIMKAAPFSWKADKIDKAHQEGTLAKLVQDDRDCLNRLKSLGAKREVIAQIEHHKYNLTEFMLNNGMLKLVDAGDNS